MVQKRSKSERRNVPKKKRNVQKVTINLLTDGLYEKPTLLNRLTSAWKGERSPRRVSSKTVESIIKQSNKNIESVTLVRSTHHVPEQREELIFAIEYKENK
jgi:hypothetical protein